jgi:adenylosuccinate synthase
MDEEYKRLLDKLSKLHVSILKEDILSNPVMTGEYMAQLRGYANFILPYVNRAIDEVNEADKKVSAERQSVYLANTKQGMSPSAAEKDAREQTRVLDSEFEIAKRSVEKFRNDYKRFDTLVMTMQSRLKEFNTEKMTMGG